MNINKLNKIISDSGMTINEVQDKAKMKSGSLYRLLSGTYKDVRLTTAFNLADALGFDINEFREEES